MRVPFFEGNSGIGVISDTDPQPIIFNSHLGKFAIVTVAKIANIDELEKRMLAANHHFAELSSGKINQTELVHCSSPRDATSWKALKTSTTA